jgi:hypothetical protein
VAGPERLCAGPNVAEPGPEPGLSLYLNRPQSAGPLARVIVEVCVWPD